MRFTRTRNDCSKGFWKTPEEDQQEEATKSCKHWLQMKSLVWMLQELQFLLFNWMAFSHEKNGRTQKWHRGLFLVDNIVWHYSGLALSRASPEYTYLTGPPEWDKQRIRPITFPPLSKIFLWAPYQTAMSLGTVLSGVNIVERKGF